MKACSPLFFLFIVFLIGCQSGKLSQSAKESMTDGKQQVDSSEQLVTDSLNQILPNELKDLPTDTTGLKQQLSDIAEDSLRSIVPEINQVLDLDSAQIAGTVQQEILDELQVDAQSLQMVNELELDSTLLSQAVNKGNEAARKYLQEQTGIEAGQVSLDSTTYRQAREIAKSEAQSYFKEQTGADVELDSLSKEQLLAQSEEFIQNQIENSEYFKELQESLGNGQSILDQQNALIEAEKARLEQYMNQQAAREKLTSAAKEYVQQNASKISAAQSDLSELKKTYAKVPSAQDLSSAVKHTSLEESSFGERLQFGGNIGIGRVDPFSLDISPLLGYRFNKLFSAGLTGTYRAQFDRENLSLQQEDGTVYGYSLYVSHKVFRNFFGYIEGENKASRIKTENGTMVNWTKGLLLGIGREFGVSKKMTMQVLVLYNFLYDNQDEMYNSPLVIKTGFQF